MQKAMEVVGIEHILNTLPGDKAILVSERKPKTCRAAGEQADEYEQAREREPGMLSAGLNTPIRGSGVTRAEETGTLRRNAGRRRTAALKAAQKKIWCYNYWEESIQV